MQKCKKAYWMLYKNSPANISFIITMCGMYYHFNKYIKLFVNTSVLMEEKFRVKIKILTLQDKEPIYFSEVFKTLL